MSSVLSRAADRMEAEAWLRFMRSEEYQRRLDAVLEYARRVERDMPRPPAGPRSPDLQRIDELFALAERSDPDEDPVPLWRAHMAVRQVVLTAIAEARAQRTT